MYIETEVVYLPESMIIGMAVAGFAGWELVYDPILRPEVLPLERDFLVFLVCGVQFSKNGRSFVGGNSRNSVAAVLLGDLTSTTTSQ